MTEENTPDEKQSVQQEKFVRWQGITIRQLSYAINLFLTFALASIGFILHLLISATVDLTACQLYLNRLALIFLIISGVLGIFCTINRLKDFRDTARIANPRTKGHEKCEARLYAKGLGKNTWRLFWSQVIAFIIGIVPLIATVFLT